MNNIGCLPHAMQIAYIMGARIQAFIPDLNNDGEGGWIPLYQAIIGHKTLVRVHPNDESILKFCESFAVENRYEFKYNGGTFWVPHLAVGGAPVIVAGGPVIRINLDGSIEQVTSSYDELKAFVEENTPNYGFYHAHFISEDTCDESSDK